MVISNGSAAAAVWGQMSAGGGHTKLQGSMATLGVPVMSKNSFATTEQGIRAVRDRSWEGSKTVSRGKG